MSSAGRRRFGLGGIAAIAAIVLGLGIVIATPAMHLFSGAPAGQRIINRFSYTLSSPGLVQLRSGFATTQALSNQFFGQTLPDVRHQLHLSPQRFDRLLARRYPAVAEATRTIPPAVKFVAPTIPLISGSHDDFESARTLPAFGLPPRATPWVFVAIGLVLAALGTLALARPRRATLALLLVAGVVLIAVPLGLSVPSKAQAGKHLGDVGRITLSPEAATTALATMHRSDRLVAEAEHRLIPDLAARAGVSPTAYAHALAHKYPAVAHGLAAYPRIRPAGYALVANMRASLVDYTRVDAVPVLALPWVIIGPGIVLTVLAGLALVLDTGLGRRR